MRERRAAQFEPVPLDRHRRERRRVLPVRWRPRENLNEGLRNVRATAEVTAASVDNLKLIRDGRADIAFTLADTLDDAVHGRAAFEGRAVPARGWRCSTPITPTSSRSRRRASSGRRSARALVSDRLTGEWHRGDRLAAAGGGRPRSAMRRPAAGAWRSESADALKDGKIDAFFWSGGLPTAAVQDLSHTPGSPSG